MQINKVNVKEALNNVRLIENGYRYIWAQSISSNEIGLIEEIALDKDTLLEARIFNSDKELHLFYYDDELCAVETVKEAGDLFKEEKQVLRAKYGKYITVRNYIGVDPEDGQASFVQSVFCGYERG